MFIFEYFSFCISLLQKLGDIMEMMFGGRYVILMMALFSIYTGLIYNEFFSVPFEMFGRSAYECRDPTCRYRRGDRKFVPIMFEHICNCFAYLITVTPLQ